MDFSHEIFLHESKVLSAKGIVLFSKVSAKQVGNRTCTTFPEKTGKDLRSPINLQRKYTIVDKLAC